MAQDKGSLEPVVLPPLANPADPALPAKQVFGRALTPTELQTRSIGFYSRGCLAGAKALPVDGETWQVMRLSRNRNWGHPALISFLERFSKKAADKASGPASSLATFRSRAASRCCTGHASHQIGLDADVWLTPMPDRTLTRSEREEISAVSRRWRTTA